jgi:hypothetical protein
MYNGFGSGNRGLPPHEIKEAWVRRSFRKLKTRDNTLLRAVEMGQLETVKKLSPRNVDAFKDNEGNTPLLVGVK